MEIKEKKNKATETKHNKKEEWFTVWSRSLCGHVHCVGTFNMWAHSVCGHIQYVLGFLVFIFHWKSYTCFCWKEVQVCSNTELPGWYNAIHELLTYLCFPIEAHVVVNQISSGTHGC